MDGRSSQGSQGTFLTWRIHAACYCLVVLYAIAFLKLYIAGIWPVDKGGSPRLYDFAAFWIAGKQAVAGNVLAILDQTQFVKLQAELTKPFTNQGFYLNWPYPPIFLLMMAPIAMLSYLSAFIVFQAVTLLGYVTVIFSVVRRQISIALALGSPFTVLTVLHGQTGFLRASLLGGGLLILERRPLLAGVLIGCLAFKPQFGILIPVALIAAKKWRVIASAIVTVWLLLVVSIAEFGIEPWKAFPQELISQGSGTLLLQSPREGPWAIVESAFGLIRYLHGSAGLAWLVQGFISFFAALVVWRVWRTSARLGLKAAILSAATLIATPFEWYLDFAVAAIPIAFLAADQMRFGVVWGEQAAMVVIALLYLLSAWFISLGYPPMGPILILMLVGVTLARIVSARSKLQSHYSAA